jgi:hypothetical protein
LEFSGREWQILLTELALTATEMQESGNSIQIQPVHISASKYITRTEVHLLEKRQ